jgi:RHS repeat-associated protein/uncharacterized repeat protein (TIGR01451 family)
MAQHHERVARIGVHGADSDRLLEEHASRRLTGVVEVPVVGRKRSRAHARSMSVIVVLVGVSMLVAGVPSAAACPTPNANVHLDKTVTSAKLVPTMTLQFAADKANAVPGDRVTYTATVKNTGAALSISGEISASATGSIDATVASFDDVVWTGRCKGTKCADHHSNHGHDVSQWDPLAGTAGHIAGFTPTYPPAASGGLTLQAVPVAATGVTYPAAGDRIAGTKIGKGKTAKWTYTATIVLSPGQAADFALPTKVGEIRNTFRVEVTPRNANAAQPATVDTEFGQKLFVGGQAGIGSIRNAAVDVVLPDGSHRSIGGPANAAFATIVPGASASGTTTYLVPPVAPKGAAETDAVYLARLAASNGIAMNTSASAAGSSMHGPVLAAPSSISVTTTKRLPIVGIAKSGPATANAGDHVTYQLALANTGSATAASVAVADQLPAGGAATVTGAPAAMAPNASGTATAAFDVPATQPSGALTDIATVAWTDANGNAYGPVSSQATTVVTETTRVAHIVLTPELAGPDVTGTSQALTAVVTDSADVPVPGQLVTFVVTGPNATSGSATTDVSGTATFSYTGTVDGTDNVQASTGTGPALLTSNTASIGWVTPIVPVSTTAITGTFFAGGSGPFTHHPGDVPAFSQQFPTINFNPPFGTIPHTPPGYNIGVETRPFTDVTTDPQGNYSGFVVAQGDGHQAGSGDLFDFDAYFTANFVIAEPGDVTFNFYSDDGFIFGVGNGATRVSGSIANPPPDGLSPFMRYPVVGAYNGVTAPIANNVTVHFPAAGTYPYEVDYDECCGGQIALTMAANGEGGVPAAGSLNLTPTNPVPQAVGQSIPLTLHALTATGTPAANLPVAMTVSGVNSQTVTGTTDATGTVVLSYSGTNPGTDLVLVGANLSGSPTVSNTVAVNWSYTVPGQSTGPCSAINDLTPADGSTVTAPTPITATVAPPSGQSVTTWKVTVQDRRAGSQPFELASGTGAPPSTISTLDPTLMDNGDFTITVEVNDSAGNQCRRDVTIVVDGKLKLGEFSQTFQDMNVAVGGIPIQVTRTYDSFDRANVGDFGNGWRLGLANYRVTTNRSLGDGGWSMYPLNCNLFCLTGFSTSRRHTVTITDPSGHQEIFDATPTGGDEVFWEGDMAFTAHPGTATTSKLEVDNGGGHFYYGNDGTLRAGNPAGPVYEATRFKLTTKTGQVLVLDKTTGLVSATDRAGNRVTVDANGVHSSNGPSITWVRDGLGRIQTVTGAAGTVTYTYDGNGDLRVVTDFSHADASYDYLPGHYLNKIAGPGGLTIKKITYKPDGRVDTITDIDGHVAVVNDDPNLRTERVDASDGRGFTTSTFDARGNAVTVDAVFDGVHHTSTFTYNAHDLVETTTDPNHHTQTAHYDTADNMYSFVDANGHETSAVFDPFGQPKSVTDATGHSVMFDYDPVSGDLTRMTDPDLHPRVYGYGPGGHVSSASDGVHPATTFTYFPDGKIQSRTDGNGVTTSVDYTSIGQIWHEFHAEGTVTYSYNAAGQRTGVADATGTTSFDFDPLGRVTKVTSPQGVISYGYADPLHPSQRTSMITPQAAFTYHYDAGGRVDSVTGPEGTTTFAYAYAGVKTITRPNGVVTTYTYDVGGRLTDLVHTRGLTVLAGFHYPSVGGLDNNGNRRVLNQTVNGHSWTETYGLDALDRLQDVTYSDTGAHAHYEYYPSGNRKQLTVTGAPDSGVTNYGYDAAQQLTSTTFTPTSGPAVSRLLGYDNNGNETSDGAGSSFVWNSQNQMIGATIGSVPHTYAFDADGVRVTADGHGQLWDQSTQLPSLVTSANSTQTYVGDQLIAQRTGSVSTFPLADALGSTRAVTDAAGAVIATSQFDVYGAPRAVSAPNEFGFTGQQTDATGLVNLRSRMLDTTSGRFLSTDSLQPNAAGTQGLGLYSYAASNPTAGSDPSGHSLDDDLQLILDVYAAFVGAFIFTLGCVAPAIMMNRGTMSAAGAAFGCTAAGAAAYFAFSAADGSIPNKAGQNLLKAACSTASNFAVATALTGLNAASGAFNGYTAGIKFGTLVGGTILTVLGNILGSKYCPT